MHFTPQIICRVCSTPPLVTILTDEKKRYLHKKLTSDESGRSSGFDSINISDGSDSCGSSDYSDCSDDNEYIKRRNSN